MAMLKSVSDPITDAYRFMPTLPPFFRLGSCREMLGLLFSAKERSTGISGKSESPEELHISSPVEGSF